MSDPSLLPATAAVRGLRTGTLSAAELTDALLARIAAREPDLRAFAWHDPASARRLLERARELSGVDAAGAAVSGTARGGVAVPLLSERELEVAALVRAGRTHREIGAQLYLSPKTVEHHVARRVPRGAHDRARRRTRREDRRQARRKARREVPDMTPLPVPRHAGDIPDAGGSPRRPVLPQSRPRGRANNHRRTP